MFSKARCSVNTHYEGFHHVGQRRVFKVEALYAPHAECDATLVPGLVLLCSFRSWLLAPRIRDGLPRPGLYKDCCMYMRHRRASLQFSEQCRPMTRSGIVLGSGRSSSTRLSSFVSRDIGTQACGSTLVNNVLPCIFQIGSSAGKKSRTTYNIVLHIHSPQSHRIWLDSMWASSP